MVAKAVAPAAWPALLASGLARPWALGAVLVCAVGGAATYGWAVRRAPRGPAAAPL